MRRVDRDTWIVTTANFFTGIFAGFVVFGFLGYMADIMHTSVDKVIETGWIQLYHSQLQIPLNSQLLIILRQIGRVRFLKTANAVCHKFLQDERTDIEVNRKSLFAVERSTLLSKPKFSRV
jgi:hypothetical protein